MTIQYGHNGSYNRGGRGNGTKRVQNGRERAVLRFMTRGKINHVTKDVCSGQEGIMRGTKDSKGEIDSKI